MTEIIKIYNQEKIEDLLSILILRIEENTKELRRQRQ
tara:strand:- start:1089 stop:1199 length:111 start_codon:yes stop_codon:yes gene_type:complete